MANACRRHSGIYNFLVIPSVFSQFGYQQQNKLLIPLNFSWCVWVSAIKQASHTLELFMVWVSATKQASHTLKLSIAWVSATKQASHTLKLSAAWVSAMKQASHTHKLFTLRRKKGTEELAPIICAHVEAEEGHREACSYHLCPR